MKYIKKLLPIASILTTSTLVVPLVVGCKDTTKSNFDIEGITVDDVGALLNNGYTRKNPAPEYGITPYIGEYLTKCNNDPAFYGDDTFDFWGNIQEDEQIFYLPKGTTGSITIGNVSANVENELLSYAIQFNINVPYSYKIEGGHILNVSLQCNLIWEFENVAVYMKYSKCIQPESKPPFYLWLLCIDTEREIPGQKIGLNGTIKSKDTDTETETNISFNVTNNDPTQWLEMVTLSTIIQHPMSYYQHIEGPSWK